RFCPGMDLPLGTNEPFLTSLPLTDPAASRHVPGHFGAWGAGRGMESTMTVNQQKLNMLAERLFGDLSAGYGGVMVSIGDKLGLYKAMAGAGPLSSQEVARRAGCAERYVREWLNSQVAGGYIDYHPKSATYELTPEQAAVLADDSSPVF